jgi:CrcB protein
VDQALPAPAGLPLATFLINVSGAFALGWLLERLAAGPDAGTARAVRLAVGTGLLGGFTTYSALAVEAVLLLDAGRPAAALLYLAVTLLAGFAAAFWGMAAAVRVRRKDPSSESAAAARPLRGNR